MKTTYIVSAQGYTIITNIWNEKVPCSFRYFKETFTNLKDAMIYIDRLQTMKAMSWDDINLTTCTDFTPLRKED